MPEQPVTNEHPTDTPPDPSDVAELGGANPVEAGVHSSGLAIIASKIGPAAPGRAVMRRPRLVDWFDRQSRARLILVSAEAGYGKSTLLNEHALNAAVNCVWYRIETSDGDWITFLSYMVAAMREVAPGFGRSTEALLRNVAAMGSTREVVLGQFLADLGTLDLGPTDIVLDDYHLIEGSADVRMILGRLLERAPAEMRIILAGRGRPNLALGRLVAQGQVSELTIDDLRFSKSEINELFSTTYRQPLDKGACDIIAERTEGWAASLQLVSASIAVSRPSEVGAFIEALDGARGPIYDFLAEEVLTRLSPRTQRVLIHASLIDRVRPILVSAALSILSDPPNDKAVRAALDDAEALGLFADRGTESGGRVHPLFRQFLAHQLELVSSPSQIRKMHHAIAVEAQPLDWLVAAKHFALANEPDQAMRVLGSAASEALGTGAWGAAVQVLDLMPDTTPPPSVEVIKARALVSDGKPDEAIQLLNEVGAKELEDDERALVSLARASAHQTGGHGAALWEEVRILQQSGHSDPVVNRLADAWALIGAACAGGSITRARSSLDTLARSAGKQSLSHFEGIALHNSATAALSQADYDDAVRISGRARAVMANSPPDASIQPSTMMVEALAIAEVGELDRGIALAQEAVSSAGAHLDVVADAAYFAAIRGNLQDASVLEARLAREMANGPTQVGTPHQLEVARITRLLASGRFDSALSSAQGLVAQSGDELDGISRGKYLVATASYLSGAQQLQAVVSEARQAIQRQQAWRWEYRLRLVESAVDRDGSALSRWIEECERASQLAILESADVLGASLHLLDDFPEALDKSITHHLSRWRPVLLRQLKEPARVSGPAAARLLARLGSYDDVETLASFERRTASGSKSRLSRTLVRRISPTLRVHDLGRTTYEISGSEGRTSAARRKALSLLLFLVTRPKQTATREQVMEELWPNQNPSSAVNSLHQTLHFVRRDIAPWSEGSITADYVPLDSELIYLDPELVQVDSVAFMRQATEALARSDLGRAGPSISELYTGRFAPEFEYEDWAEDWRTLLHTQFLLLTQATADALVSERRSQQAIEVLTRAVEIDPLAFDIRATLIRTLTDVGATDAAGEHYRRYANLTERELDERAPTFGEVVGGTETQADA